jgi:hypothetical protein
MPGAEERTSTPISVHIGTVIRNARAFNIQHWQGAPGPMDDILQTVADLFALLKQRKVKSVLVGGIALLQYIQGRNTEDIDLILAVSSLKKLPEIQLVEEDIYFARGQYKNLQIDFLLTRNPLFAHVQRKYITTRRFLEQNITSATVEGLVLLKLYALPSLYRQGNFARVGLYENDVATLMYYHRPDMDKLQQELAPFVSENDLAAIQDIVTDMSKRIARFTQEEGAHD